MVQKLHPGYLAMVMATGIISTAFFMFEQMLVSRALLWVAAIAYVVLVALYAWRIARYPDDVSADAREPQKSFGFFTFVAASNVLAIRVALAGNLRLSELLWIFGTLGWLVLTYAIPAVLIMQPNKKPIGDALNGSWLIWVVGTQSVAAAAATLAYYRAGRVESLATVAVFMWAVGVLLYIALIGMIMIRLFFHKLEPVYLSPPYWINMGACAISVIAGARILMVPQDFAVLQVTRPIVEGVSFMLWAWGTWWIPSLVIMGIWRHGYQHHPLSYEPTLWSMVFPLGMYAASSTAYGRAVHLPLLVSIARWEVWIALAAWALVFAGLVSTWLQPRRQSGA